MGTETKCICYAEKASADNLKATKGPVISKDHTNSANGKKTSHKPVVPHLPIYIDENNVIDGAKEVLQAIRPKWNIDAVQFKKFTDGITNKLVGCFYNEAIALQTLNGSKQLNCECYSRNSNNSSSSSSSNSSNSSSNSNNSSSNNSNSNNSNSNSNSSNNSSSNIQTSTNGKSPRFIRDDCDNASYDGDTETAAMLPYDVPSLARNDRDDGRALETEVVGGEGGAASASASVSASAAAAVVVNAPKNDRQVVLVRVYGNNTDLLIDRKAEIRNIVLLHSYGFAPSLYATFDNGLAYAFIPGVTLNANNILRPEVWRLVAQRMAEMHRMVRPEARTLPPHEDQDNIPMLWKKSQRFFDLVPERFSDPDKHKRVEATFLPIARIRAEFERLYRQLESLGSPLVFSHNDLLLGNVVYTESLQSVSFIDYEYADLNFQAFDIGNHFAEFAGVDEVDYARYPGPDFQYEWLRVYLQTYLSTTHVSDDQVYRLYVQANQFALASHFFWAIWSLIQAEHSTLDFDYVAYAHVRYNEYLTKKDEFLALNIDCNGRG